MLQSVASSRCMRMIDRNRPAWYFGFLVVSYILYLIFGAAVFSSLELPYEDLLRRKLVDLKRQFLNENECMSEGQLDMFLDKVLEASNYGVSILNNETRNWNWDFMSSLFFASTVLSTTVQNDADFAAEHLTVPLVVGQDVKQSESYTVTGYGHTVPLSDAGKTFCILYSVIGIPFTLLLFTALVQRIIIYVTRKPVLYIHLHWGFPKHIVAIVHALILGFITIGCFFLIPAAAFSILEEDWNFLESFYFCFISLSTIGLGDYVPGEGYNQKFRHLYKLGITCYLLLGLIMMLVVLETFCELQELKIFRKLFYVKKTKDEDQENIVEHDQLAFSSISDQVDAFKEDKLSEPFVALQPVVNYTSDGSINNE